jgi:hypothetical protein
VAVVTAVTAVTDLTELLGFVGGSGDGSAEGLAGRLRGLTRLARVVEAVEAATVLELVGVAEADSSVVVEQVVAGSTCRSLSAAGRVVERARVVSGWPDVWSAWSTGALSAGHVDVLVRARRGLPKALRARFDEQTGVLAAGGGVPVEEFRDRVNAVVRELEADDGVGRLARQKRRTRVRAWTDRDGMWNLHGRFDPERGLVLSEVLRRRTEHVFRTGDHPVGDEMPDDPVERQAWFQAIALEQLMTGTANTNGDSGTGGVEVVVTIDERTLLEGRHPGSRVDTGNLEVPVEVLRRLARCARLTPVVLDDHGVAVRVGRPVWDLATVRDSLARPVQLDHGRSRRHASKAQRRALRAMYRHCAIPGCRVPVDRTQAHHVDHWEHGGRTDLARLIPLCPHHHDRLHAEGWDLELGSDRSLTIRRNGHVIMTTGPPAGQWA